MTELEKLYEAIAAYGLQARVVRSRDESPDKIRLFKRSTVHADHFAIWGPTNQDERNRLAALFEGRSIQDMRKLWDDENDRYDCADIHGYMNMLGDGAYCAV